MVGGGLGGGGGFGEDDHLGFEALRAQFLLDGLYGGVVCDPFHGREY